jgi:hypothetical protein
VSGTTRWPYRAITATATKAAVVSEGSPIDVAVTGIGRHASLQCQRDCLELGQRRRQVLDDLASDDLGSGEVVEILERLVAQPGDVEVDLVPGEQLVVVE